MSSDSTGSWLMGFLKPRNSAITLSISLHGDKTTAGPLRFLSSPVLAVLPGDEAAALPCKHAILLLLLAACTFAFRLLAKIMSSTMKASQSVL